MKDAATPITCDNYLPDAVFDALVAKLVHLVQEPFEVAGTDARTEVVSALGELGGVWPEAVLR